jgi:hypothetical protein
MATTNYDWQALYRNEEQKNSTKNILLTVFAMVSIGVLISRSVMEAVGNNDGKDCPKVGGPALACTWYGLTMLVLIGMVVKMRMDKKLENNLKFGLFILLIICTMSIFIAYIPFTIKAQNHSSTDTECLTNENKDAIEVFELIINAALIILTPIMLFM